MAKLLEVRFIQGLPDALLCLPKDPLFCLELSRSQADINRGGYERGKTHRGGVGPRKCFQHAFVLRARSLAA